MEEVLKSLLEVGALTQQDGRDRLTKPLAELDVPETIQDTIMARIDRLAESPKRALQLAADVEVVQACAQVYNDWAAWFVSCNPKRFIGVSVIPMNNVDWAVTELARTLKRGLLNPMINCQAPAGCPPYSDTAADYSIPHIGVEQVLWGSDFPHFRSIGREAQAALHKLLGILPRADQEEVGGNAAKVFNLD
jgi:hypothetical protein